MPFGSPPALFSPQCYTRPRPTVQSRSGSPPRRKRSVHQLPFQRRSASVQITSTRRNPETATNRRVAEAMVVSNGTSLARASGGDSWTPAGASEVKVPREPSGWAHQSPLRTALSSTTGPDQCCLRIGRSNALSQAADLPAACGSPARTNAEAFSPPVM